MINAINTIETIASKQPKYQDGDYIKDDLLYCGKCNSPKQSKCNLFGKEKIVTCLCKCQVASLKKEEEQRAEKERTLHIENLKSNGIKDKEILNYTFENDDNSRPKSTQFMKRYVEKFEEMYKTNTGLLLWGDVGSGKTYHACCVGNALLSKGIAVMITDFTKILNELQGIRENRVNYLKEFNNYKLLILDDFGAERQSEYTQEQILSVVDQRYKNGQPVIVTTNLSLDEMKNPKNVELGRIYDRILEMCIPIKFTGESRRIIKAEEKRIQAEKILLNA